MGSGPHFNGPPYSPDGGVRRRILPTAYWTSRSTAMFWAASTGAALGRLKKRARWRAWADLTLWASAACLGERVCLCRFVTDQDRVAEAPELESLRCHSCCHADAPRGLPRNQSPHLLFPRRSRDFTESPRILGLYSRLCPSRMKFPQRFPCFCSVPGFRASTAVPTFPRRSLFLQCPRILGLYSGSHFSTALPMVLQCPRIQGLYAPEVVGCLDL